ncbi:iron ABC transporter permease [Aureibacillus halotolerans]|uniref:Iron complex transport system permease protein n=1 Tax=Aureibacillus halotolerans TaxID=1508390 RepID=A0A4R6TYM2_9BACI|nr:iron ABC transporter permease [Aureibacillus halotolerans]TDQ37139.1 iron complex transport system permease protein [Aureibacillus halotolerans]
MSVALGKKSLIKAIPFRLAAIFGGGLFALVLLMFASLCIGEAPIQVGTVVDALMNRQDTMDHNLIWDIRLPRMVLGLFAGGALAVAGALLQTITRNPLAASDTLGINAGAYFMVVLGTIFFPSVLQASPFLIAVLGGTGAATLAFVMAGGPTANPIRLTLAGMIVSLVIASLTSALHIFFSEQSKSLFVWGAGSLSQINWDGVLYVWPWIVGGILLVWLYSTQFDILRMDEATAQSLGQKVKRVKMTGLVLAILLAAIVVSVVGPIGFVGLVAPHLVKLAGLRTYRVMIPAVVLWGSVLITGADVLARFVRSGSMGELPVGAVMAIIGAPWLIWFVMRKMQGLFSNVGNVSMSVGSKPLRLPFKRLFIGGGLVIVALILVSMTIGATQVPLIQLWKNLIGAGAEDQFSVLLNLRLPRTLVAAGAGVALAVSGVLIQSSVRNPLADASIVGVTSGAGLAALLVMVVWPELPSALLPVAAVIGSVAAAAIVFGLAWRRGMHPSVLILLGIAVSAVGAAGIQVLIIRGAIYGSSGYVWITGSTYGRSWDHVMIIAGFLVVLLPIALMLARRFDLLVFDEDSASGLGLNVQQTRLWAILVGVLLAAGAVACVGTVGFLGLIAPHAVRVLIGHNTRQSILLSSLLGAFLLVMADTVGRTVMAPTEIPSGILITLLGAPYFLYLMARSQRHSA